MKTLTQFKQELGVSKIDLLQKNGRAFAKVQDIDLVVSSNCDLSKELFIIPLTKEDGTPVANAVLMINSDIKTIASV